MNTQTTLRDMLEINYDAAENGTLNVPKDETLSLEQPEVQKDERPRDESGKFIPKETKEASKEPPEVVQAPVEPPKPSLQRPTTWKKDYLPLWDKMQSGQPLTPEESLKMLEYANQRENEFKSGVSTYKAEAENAKTLREAMAPFEPLLQQHNINPAQWITNLGNAHKMLALGSPQEKIQIFAKLAQDYGVPLAAFSQGQDGNTSFNPVVADLMQQIQDLSGKVNTVASWRDKKEQQDLVSAVTNAGFTFENGQITGADAEKYPHFEAVRGTMAQLLEKEIAPDLQTAYEHAVKLNPDVWQLEQERLLAKAREDVLKSAAVKNAKAAAVSTKSSTPSGQVSSGGDKDRRAVLSEAFDEAAGRV